jgi:hypothetical protein
MQISQSDLNELTRKANDLTSDTEDVSRLLRSRLGAEHQLVHSADEMHASLETLAHELRTFCSPANHDEIEVSEDT